MKSVDAGAAATQAGFERALADALTAPDAVAAVRELAEDPAHPETLRASLRRIDAAGLRITALLIARLRFARLLEADPIAAADYERDPVAFTARFRAYHQQVPPTAFFPPEERALFRAWCSGQVQSPSGGSSAPPV